MPVTIRDVARLAGVSAMTVSRVANGQEGVAGETRRRVEAAIAELGYVPNGLARGLISRHTRIVGLVVPDIANPFFTLVVRGVEEIAWRSGHHLMLCNTRGDLARERSYIRDMVALRAEGLVVAPVGDRSAPGLQELTRNDLPFVLVDRSVRGKKADLVQGDSIAGARQLVARLLAEGHRAVAMLTEQSEVSTARDRALGYEQALGAAGIRIRSELVVETSSIDPAGSREATRRLLALPEPPTAIFAVNNIAAVGVLEAARDVGLAVPGELAVACFDDLGFTAGFGPQLTVLAQPAETFGTIAMQLLLDRISGDETGPGRTVVLPGELLI
ncbi:MAG TPA: LacI family DNA-binding transcriptional regulator [Gaiellaceae bacterium]|jgi:LacI family transcriptional regulator|nr:LacI family DNA-binding transcriptional regulator [Gaiellaceae bacterium]